MFTHTIVAGDTFYALAERYGCSLQEILAANPGVIPERLQIGQIVNIPVEKKQSSSSSSSISATHTIVAGDTFYGLSQKYGCSLEAIRSANPGVIPEQLQIGQVVRLPGSVSTPTTTVISTPSVEPKPVPKHEITKRHSSSTNDKQSVIVGYFASWSIYQRKFFVSDIPADKITHINYAFANINSDGEITRGDNEADTDKAFPGDTWEQPLRGNFNQLIKLKQKYPHLRTLISVGGWTWSRNFSDVALNDGSRRKFANSCVAFIEKYSFDGVDLDWEYPVSGGLEHNIHRPEDKQNYALLLKELRQQLDNAGNRNGNKYLLTVATGAAPQRITDMDLLVMVQYLDWINVMTYDYHGGWETKTGHNAPLYKNDAETVDDIPPSFMKSKFNIHASIEGYVDAGVPRNKLVVGMPLYGRGWAGVTSTVQNGFSQATSGQLPPGTWENGVFDYDDIKRNHLSSSTRYWDDASKVPFLFNRSTGVWITYDDVESIQLKCDFINQQGLGGAMFWELSGDRNSELISKTFNALK